METFSALLTICAGNSPVTSDFPIQRPVTRSFDVFFDPRPNIQLSKQWWGWWFETPSCPLWRHCNAQMSGRFAHHLIIIIMQTYRKALSILNVCREFCVTVCLRLGQFSQLSFVRYVVLCVCSLPITFVLVVRICALYLVPSATWKYEPLANV